jgi:hypothetical protein
MATTVFHSERGKKAEGTFGSRGSQENPDPFPAFQTHALNYPRARKKLCLVTQLPGPIRGREQGFRPRPHKVGKGFPELTLSTRAPAATSFLSRTRRRILSRAVGASCWAEVDDGVDLSVETAKAAVSHATTSTAASSAIWSRIWWGGRRLAARRRRRQQRRLQS